MSDDKLGYYEGRARQEADAATDAASQEAASAHRRLAAHYEAHARELRDHDNASVDEKRSPASETEAPRRKLSIR